MNQWKYDLLCKDGLQDIWEHFDFSPNCFMTVVHDLSLVSIVFFLFFFFYHHGIYSCQPWLDVKTKQGTLSTFFSRAVCQCLSVFFVVVFLSLFLFIFQSYPPVSPSSFSSSFSPLCSLCFSLLFFLSCSFSLINRSLIITVDQAWN